MPEEVKTEEVKNIIEITSKAQFDEEIKSDVLTIVDFWAVWCGPCRLLKPLLEKITNEHKDIKLLTVNVDENSDLAAEYDINSIPAVFMFRNGEIVDSFVGVLPEDEILKKIEVLNRDLEEK